MAKKPRIIDEAIPSLQTAWAGTDAEGEWGYDKKRVEERIKASFSEQDTKIAGRLSGIRVNGSDAPKDSGGVAEITVPLVDSDLSEDSQNAVRNSTVAKAIGQLREDVKNGGKVKGITINGVAQTPNADGIVNIPIDTVDVDESLDATSTNAVSNAAATQAINELKGAFGSGLDADIDQDAGTVTLKLTDKTGRPLSEVEIPMGGGSGDGTVSKIVVTATVDQSQVKEGGRAVLTWRYDHVDGEGVSDGVKAAVEITVRRGTTQTYGATLADVAPGTSDTLDLTDYLLAGTVDIYVKATCTDADGTTKAKQAYTTVQVVTLNLSTTFDISAALQRGGYQNETVEVPFAVTGSGTKVVTLYVDGVQRQSKTISRSGTTNDAFTIDTTGMAAGRHNLQMVAERDGLLSDSLWLDFLVAGSEEPWIGLRTAFKDGRIYRGDYKPVIDAEQYGQFTLDFAAWNPSGTTSAVTVSMDGSAVASMTVNRQVQQWSTRLMEGGRRTVLLTCGATGYQLFLDVAASSLDVGEATQSLQLKLTASGRSNSETNPADWGGVTTMAGVDFKSSGWFNNALLLRNGAGATIGIKPFAKDATGEGLTVELEYRLTNVMDRDADVIHCMEMKAGSAYGKGFSVKAGQVQLYTGDTKMVDTPDEDAQGNKIQRERPIGVAMEVASDEWLKVAFVIHTRSTASAKEGNSLMCLYINGVLSKVDQYTGDFMQEEPLAITVDSTWADVELRTVRVYGRALSSDEELGNWVVDRETAQEMEAKYTANAVLGTDGKVSADILRRRGRGVMVIVPESSVLDAVAANDKKKDFTASKIYWYSPYGEEYDFVAENNYFRLQGTSSTKYPRKNWRIYLAKGPEDGANTRLYVGGKLVSGRKYALRPGESIAMNLFCMKADYSDSSMVMNTGGAKLFDQVMRDLDLLTPPQRWQKEHGQTVTVRQAIDGIPCDLFVADKDGGELTYYGQYNLNNEKAKSGKLFGMEGVDGFEPECPIALEALNNGSPMCLFQSKGSAGSDELETQLQAKFDDGFEFNFPEDVYYNTAKATSKGGTVATAKQKAAVKRLMGWLYDVTPAAMRTSPDYGTVAGWDKSKWVSARFKAEAKNYFNVLHLLTYFLFTDYWASVDQRAKNILWRTWDGLLWWATYYDGDTAQSIRNDVFMAYLYNITRDTWDAEASKWAFEGHDSWLWCLVLANFEDELREAASALRAKLTDARQLEMFNVEQMGNWCERLYNESGWFKYVQPLLEGVVENGVVKKYNYLYGLTGNRESHRTAFLTQRGALLDARYGTTTYQSDRITFYASRNAGDAADTVKVKSGDLYYYGYRTNNGDFLDGPVQAGKGETASLTFEGTLALNDPLNLCGASRITELDWREGPSCGGNFELQACRMLRVLNMSNAKGTQMQTSLVLAGLDSCIQLEQVDLTGQQGVSSGGSGLDLSAQTKLKVLRAGGTGLSTVTLAEGAPVATLVLPGTLTRLRLRYLPQLTTAGLTLQGYGSITRFEFAECPGLDWPTLLGRMANVRYIRVEGLTGKVDVATLEQFRHLGAVKADGTVTNDYCGLVGEVEASQYIDDDLYAEYQEIYPELTIRQPEYTMIEFDDSVSDDANVSNLDNRTGYKYGTDYVPSGHIASLLRQRHRVLAKLTKKPTSRAITHAGVETQQNNLDGEMTYYPLHDANSNYYADAQDVSQCTAAKLDSTEGDWMMLEPHRWSKGVNDYLKQKHYSCYSVRKERPATPDVDVLMLDDIKAGGGYRQGYKVMTGKQTLSASYTADSSYSACTVAVAGYKRVRYPGIPGTNLAGAVFTDSGGVVLESVIVSTVGMRFEAGMYLISDVPEGAANLHFSILNSADFDKVVLDAKGEKIEDMEPEWVETEEYLLGVSGCSTVGSQLRSCVAGGSTVASLPWTDFHYYAQQRGQQLIDGLMHNDIGNLFFAKYGRRDSQMQCGAGSHTNSRTTGTTAKLGMQDTVNTNGETVGGVEGQGTAFYRTENELGQVTFTTIASTNCLGYENIYGHKYDMMDLVDVPNSSGKSGRWRFRMPDGTERWVKGATSSHWITGVAHGLYMDLVPVGNMGGSSTTYHCDYYYFSSSVGRVVYRGHNHAGARGGVSNAYAYSDPSDASASVGSRLNYELKRNNNRRTAPGTCPHSGAEGGEPHQQRLMPERWNIAYRGASLVGRQRLEEVRPQRFEGSRSLRMYLMHRDGFIIEQIVADNNLEEAFDKVLRGEDREKSTEGQDLLAHRKETLDNIKNEIVQGSFSVTEYWEKDIYEGGKWRRIQITTMERRIGVFAIMNVVDAYFRKRFIRTTAASIKGRGTHDLENCIRKDMADDPDGMKYCYEFDIVHFYDNIMPEFVMYCLKRVFKDERLLHIMDGLLHMIPQGISKGLRSSQGLSNLLLSVFLDHYLKDVCGVSHFYRYCDDGRIFSGVKLNLWMCRDIVHERTAQIELQIKGNERVFPTQTGVDFLGYVTYDEDFVLLRKRVKQSFARKLHKVKSRRRRRELIASFYGMAKHANCNNLFYKLTGKKMRSFKDLKVAYKPEDGKKRFPGVVVSIRELVNLPIVVKDFETGIKTEQGEDRCIVAIEVSGEAKKFFTNSEEMKNILAQVKEMPDGFPFETTIKTETFGKGRTKYVFT